MDETHKIQIPRSHYDDFMRRRRPDGMSCWFVMEKPPEDKGIEFILDGAPPQYRSIIPDEVEIYRPLGRASEAKGVEESLVMWRKNRDLRRKEDPEGSFTNWWMIRYYKTPERSVEAVQQGSVDHIAIGQRLRELQAQSNMEEYLQERKKNA